MKVRKLILRFAALVVLAGMVWTGEKEAFAAEEQSAPGRFIDIHMHLDGRYRQDGAPSPTNKSPALGRRPPPGGGPGRMADGDRGQGGLVKDYEAAADNLVAMMDRAGVARALVMPPPQSPNQRGGYTYRELLEAVRRHPDRLSLAGGGGELCPMIMGTEPANVTTALRAEFGRRAEEIIRDGAKAFGEMAVLHFSLSDRHVFERAPADHPLFLLLADIAARHDIPIDIHWEAVTEDQPTPEDLVKRSSANPARIQPTIPGIERLLAHNRKTRIVLVHGGWDNTGHQTVDLLRRLMTAHPNLYSGLKFVRKRYEPFQRGNKLADEDLKIRPEWVRLIRDFPDRFVVGADEFVGIPDRTTRKGPPSFEDTWFIIKQLPPDLRAKVGRENAARIYRLD